MYNLKGVPRPRGARVHVMALKKKIKHYKRKIKNYKSKKKRKKMSARECSEETKILRELLAFCFACENQHMGRLMNNDSAKK